MDDTGISARAFTEALGSEIAYWRRRRGISRSELAARAELSESTMGRIEREGPKDVADTWRIAQALNIAFVDLVRRAEEAVTMSVLDFGDAGQDAGRAQEKFDGFFAEKPRRDDDERGMRDTTGA